MCVCVCVCVCVYLWRPHWTYRKPHHVSLNCLNCSCWCCFLLSRHSKRAYPCLVQQSFEQFLTPVIISLLLGLLFTENAHFFRGSEIWYKAGLVICLKGLERTASASPAFSDIAGLRYVLLSTSAFLDDAVAVVPAKVADNLNTKPLGPGCT